MSKSAKPAKAAIGSIDRLSSPMRERESACSWDRNSYARRIESGLAFDRLLRVSGEGGGDDGAVSSSQHCRTELRECPCTGAVIA